MRILSTRMEPGVGELTIPTITDEAGNRGARGQGRASPARRVGQLIMKAQLYAALSLLSARTREPTRNTGITGKTKSKPRCHYKVRGGHDLSCPYGDLESARWVKQRARNLAGKNCYNRAQLAGVGRSGGI